MNTELIDLVIEQIIQDVGNADYTAIQELLCYVPEERLEGFLSELDRDPDHDGQPDEAQEWHDFDPDC